MDVPRSACDGRSVGAVGGADTATDEGCDTTRKCRIHLLGRDDVDVSVDTSGGEYEMLATDSIRRGPRNHTSGYTIHNVGVAGLTDARNAPIFDTHVGLDYAQHRIHNGYIGDDNVERPLLAGGAVVDTHTISEGFTTAIDHLVAIGS